VLSLPHAKNMPVASWPQADLDAQFKDRDMGPIAPGDTLAVKGWWQYKVHLMHIGGALCRTAAWAQAGGPAVG